MKKLPAPIKDGLIGLGIGTAIIIPGISAGTIALIFGAFKKITGAVGGLFKNFWKNLLILLPFGIGAVLAIAGLYVPFNMAFEYCMLAIICLFAGFIFGSIPSITDGVKGQKPTSINIIVLIIGFIVSVGIGVTSVLTSLGNTISDMFEHPEWYLFLIVFVVGIISSTGLIVPGLSGSLILLVLGFYKPIFSLPKAIADGTNVGINICLFLVFALGVAIGFVLFSKLMNSLIINHKQSTYYAVIGFVIGSIISIFVNSNVFDYMNNGKDHTLDYILGPILFVIGVTISILMVLYIRKHPVEADQKQPEESAK